MCKYCEMIKDKSRVIMENNTCVAFYSDEAVSSGHITIVTRNHIENYFNMSYENNEEMFMLARNCKKFIDKNFNPEGYNLGYNVGVWAGQRDKHVAMHLIPRYAGDVSPEKVSGGILNIKK